PRQLRDVRQRIPIEDRLADRIQAVRGNLAEHAAVLEAAGGAGGGARLRRQRILDQVEQRAGVVARLREVAGALERRRRAYADRVAVVDRRRHRTVFVRVEEEQLVVAARLAHRTADRVAERLRTLLRL